ncbi:hypothetical protein EQV97_11275 [Pseudomonas sp. TMW22090]|nr:hypothetical protein [Pseudomonas sp. TMW22090]
MRRSGRRLRSFDPRVWRPGSQRCTTIIDPSHGGCAWETFGSAGFLLLRFANPRTTATHSFGDDGWQPIEQKELPQ